MSKRDMIFLLEHVAHEADNMTLGHMQYMDHNAIARIAHNPRMVSDITAYHAMRIGLASFAECILVWYETADEQWKIRAKERIKICRLINKNYKDVSIGRTWSFMNAIRRQIII